MCFALYTNQLIKVDRKPIKAVKLLDNINQYFRL